MNFEPLLTAPFPVHLHVVSAICAVVLGPVVLLRRSRDKWHRNLGKMWVLAMFLTAASSFLISVAPIVGPFGPIHILSVLTIGGLWQGVSAARRGDIARHQLEMRSLYFWAIGVAGLFTFLPDRRMNILFFEDIPRLGFTLMAAIIGSGLVWYFVQSRKAVR